MEFDKREDGHVYDEPWENIVIVFSEFRNKKWIVRTRLSEKNKILDNVGIDAVTEFRIDKTRPGFFSFQIKTRASQVSLHKKRYPPTPVVVFNRQDSLEVIRKKYITLLFVYEAFNKGRKQEILKKFPHLKKTENLKKNLRRILKEIDDFLTVKIA